MPLASERPVIRVENLSVDFRTTSEGVSPLKRPYLHLRHRKKRPALVSALSDVSFSVGQGSVCGVIGSNGAGKSTLLRAIAGVFPPTRGRITVYGRVTPHLSLGMGFNNALTGRDNIILGGLIRGMTKDEIEARRDEIIEFSGLGEAIDHPMRTYSSGMFSRLGFSLSAFLDPEIILIDEALAAGDGAFKDKCRQKIVDLCSGTTTVLVVTHGLSLIKRMATDAIWLDEGKVRASGDSATVVEEYMASQEIDEDEASLDDF